MLLRNFDCLKYFLPEEARFKLPIYRSGSFRIRPIYSSRIMMMMSFFILHPNFGTIYPHHCSHTTCVGIFTAFTRGTYKKKTRVYLDLSIIVVYKGVRFQISMGTTLPKKRGNLEILFLSSAVGKNRRRRVRFRISLFSWIRPIIRQLAQKDDDDDRTASLLLF